MIEAIEAGFFQREIADASYRYQRSLETKDRVIVGVNAFEREETHDDSTCSRSAATSSSVRRARCRACARRATPRPSRRSLAALKRACRSDENVMPVR